MNKKKLYYALLEEVYVALNRYNKKPNYFNEDELFQIVISFNDFARANKLKEISCFFSFVRRRAWTRDDKNNNYQSIRVFYIPFNNLED